jgi:hypothetical protein
MRSCLLLSLLAAGLSSLVLLQVSDAALAQTPPAVSQAPAPTAPVAAPTASHLAAARELIEINGIAQSFSMAVPQFFDQIGRTLSEGKPDLEADLSQVFVQLKPEFDKRADDLTDKAALLYTQLLSEEDLKAIVAFFKSEPGKKYIQTQSSFMKDIIVTMEAWREQVATDMMTRVRAEMQKKGHQL